MPDIAALHTDVHWTSAHRFHEDPVIDDQFKHYLSLVLHGMADLGECLEVAAHLDAHDEQAWLTSWGELARRLNDRAELASLRGKTVSAASAYLRAATYWRASLMHFSFREDPRIVEHATNSKNCYDRYLELSGYPGQYVEIRYEDSFLPAHFYRSPVAAASAPILIFNQGRDAWPEDTRWVYDGAIRRGIHCLAFHGPGQGLALRLNGLQFRSDWEKVVTPVLDFAVGLSGVDPKRIGVMGLSFGGYLVPRAAVFEKRIKVCVADPGVLNWGNVMTSNMPAPLRAALDEGADAFNSTFASHFADVPLYAWALRDSLWKYGGTTPYDMYRKSFECDLTELAADISCETLVMDGTGEIFGKGEARRLYDALTCPKHYLLFDESTTAQLHCQNGGNATAAEMMFDWLDERLLG